MNRPDAYEMRQAGLRLGTLFLVVGGGSALAALLSVNDDRSLGVPAAVLFAVGIFAALVRQWFRERMSIQARRAHHSGAQEKVAVAKPFISALAGVGVLAAAVLSETVKTFAMSFAAGLFMTIGLFALARSSHNYIERYIAETWPDQASDAPSDVAK